MSFCLFVKETMARDNVFLGKLLYTLGCPSIQPCSRSFASVAGMHARKCLQPTMLTKYEKHLVSLATGRSPDSDVEEMLKDIGTLLEESSSSDVEKQNAMLKLRRSLTPNAFEAIFV